MSKGLYGCIKLHSILGMDFDETFTLVIKPNTIRVVLPIAVINKRSIRQHDVRDAFLMNFLKFCFLRTTAWFINPKLPDNVYVLFLWFKTSP